MKPTKEIMASLPLLAALFFAMTVHAQTTRQLQRNPNLSLEGLAKISAMIKADSLKPVFYSKQQGFTADPDTSVESKILGCTGDFNNNGQRDVVLLVKNVKQNKGQLVAIVTGIKPIFVLQSFDPLKEVAERNPYSILLNSPACYAKSETGKFEGLEGETYDMPGDLINYGWYSYVWDGKNDFKEIVTSD